MTYSRVSETITKLVAQAFRSGRFVVLALVATFVSLSIQPAQAQSSDTWKSIAIIGGSTAAGAYIGHRVGGSTGAWVGAATGASAGYAIDRRRRANESYNQYAYGDGGYYGDNGPYSADNGPYSGNGGSYGGPYDGGPDPYPSGYQSNNYQSSNRYSRRH